MIRNFKDGDIVTRGRQFAEGVDEVSLSIQFRLRMFLGESFIDVRKGTPWFQSILGKAPQDIAEVNVRRRILTAPKVSGLRRFRFESDLGRRRLDISATVISETGEESTATVSDEVLI